MTKPVIEFEILPEDAEGPGVFVDEVPMRPGRACAAEIFEGEHAGMWMFTCKERAEEFCYKRGLEPKFVEAGDA